MQLSDFKEDAPGRFVRTVHGLQAFVPRPLPPVLHWSNELISAIAEAERALGRLDGLGRTLPNPHLLIRPFVRREAVLSSQIEGTQASLSDLLLFEVNEKVTARVPDVREVANYVRALEHGLERVRTLPLSLRLLCEMHAILLEGVRGESRTPGQFRRTQVHIGPAGCAVDQATFVPAPPGPELERALTALEKYLHSPSDLPAVARLALVHYQFEAIHPFVDGNGRIGRLLITLMLVLDGVLSLPLLYLSAYFERHRAEYYRQLLSVSQRACWTDWLLFFAEGVTTEALDAIERAGRLRQLQATYLTRLQAARTPALLLKLVEELFKQPILTTKRVCELLDVTPRTAQQHINRLLRAGILTETTGQKRNRVFVASEIIDTLGDIVPTGAPPNLPDGS